LAKNRDLVGVLNSGYTRSGHVIRSAEIQVQGVRGFEPVAFPTFGAIALAGIGSLPSTIEDRSVRVGLERRQPAGARAERIGLRQLQSIRDKIAPHFIAHADAIGSAMAKGVPDSAMPPSLNDRDADNWRPLLAIAALAGDPWPARAYKAAELLCGESADGDRGPEWTLRQIAQGVQDVHQAAVDRYQEWVRGGSKAIPGKPMHPPVPFITSEDLAAWLMEKDDSGFSDCRDIGTAKLRVARALQPFGVTPELRKIHGKAVRGYDVPAIAAVWRRYQ